MKLLLPLLVLCWVFTVDFGANLYKKRRFAQYTETPEGSTELLILVFIEEEIFLTRIVGPDFLNIFVGLSVIFEFI